MVSSLAPVWDLLFSVLQVVQSVAGDCRRVRTVLLCSLGCQHIEPSPVSIQSVAEVNGKTVSLRALFF